MPMDLMWLNVFITRSSIFNFKTVPKSFVHLGRNGWVTYIKYLQGVHKSTAGDCDTQRRFIYKRAQGRFVIEVKTI